ncbi:MAG: hypothetical protein M3R46_02795 [Actinomycetota bacterium]|nr:hypothetical protein [Actinomycetota bacterium]
MTAEASEQFHRRQMEQAAAQRRFRLAVPGLQPRDAWSIFANTDLLNRAIGSPEVELCNVPVRPGVARLEQPRLNPLPSHGDRRWRFASTTARW